MFPSIMNFPLQGVKISKSADQYCDVKSCCVKLEDLEQSTSGQYRCEISGDAPEFKLVHAVANMTIAGIYKLLFIYTNKKGKILFPYFP